MNFPELLLKMNNDCGRFYRLFEVESSKECAVIEFFILFEKQSDRTRCTGHDSVVSKNNHLQRQERGDQQDALFLNSVLPS